MVSIELSTHDTQEMVPQSIMSGNICMLSENDFSNKLIGLRLKDIYRIGNENITFVEYK